MCCFCYSLGACVSKKRGETKTSNRNGKQNLPAFFFCSTLLACVITYAFPFPSSILDLLLVKKHTREERPKEVKRKG